MRGAKSNDKHGRGVRGKDWSMLLLPRIRASRAVGKKVLDDQCVCIER